MFFFLHLFHFFWAGWLSSTPFVRYTPPSRPAPLQCPRRRPSWPACPEAASSSANPSLFRLVSSLKLSVAGLYSRGALLPTSSSMLVLASGQLGRPCIGHDNQYAGHPSPAQCCKKASECEYPHHLQPGYFSSPRG
jgi:hypothetical protein